MNLGCCAECDICHTERSHRFYHTLLSLTVKTAIQPSDTHTHKKKSVEVDMTFHKPNIIISYHLVPLNMTLSLSHTSITLCPETLKAAEAGRGAEKYKASENNDWKKDEYDERACKRQNGVGRHHSLCSRVTKRPAWGYSHHKSSNRVNTHFH